MISSRLRKAMGRSGGGKSRVPGRPRTKRRLQAAAPCRRMDDGRITSGAKRLHAKYTINPAITWAIFPCGGLGEVGKLADLVL